VGLSGIQLSGDLFAAFLDAATSITALFIHWCGMEAPGGVLAVADALRRNTNIQCLELDWLDETQLIRILNGLASNTTVQDLGLIVYDPSLHVSLAVNPFWSLLGPLRNLSLESSLQISVLRWTLFNQLHRA
jgi:hypothetical protein